MGKNQNIKNLGIGVGLRPVHYPEIFAKKSDIDWFEIISENFLIDGPPIRNLEKILETYPVVMHGVSLAIGSPDPINFDYLKKIKELARKTKSPWISDHLCWGRVPGSHYHDLLPLPYTKEVIDYVVERVKIVQDYLEVPFALENVSSYAAFQEDEMPEWEFYTAVVEKSDIFMMLDVNNIYVSSKNHGFEPEKYYENLPFDRVLQIHLAGHSNYDKFIIDTHNNYVCDEVWQIYKEVYPKTGGVSTLLEWDDHFLSFEDTCKEALKAKQFQQEIENVSPRS
ncbi:MAG: DUF692 domain-containing protein [Chlamydiota bacterium]|jgi:uncharacterized protein (UPF0276 family)